MTFKTPDPPSTRGADAGAVTPWQHFVLPPDAPLTRINASLFKIGLRHFHAVVFNQKGSLTQVARKKWGT